jgi:hypothetical protein
VPILGTCDSRYTFALHRPIGVTRRLPLLLGCSLSPASMTRALASSSLNLPISAMTFSSGIIPASDSFVALTITMTFIALFSLV